MAAWFTEYHAQGCGLSLEIKEILHVEHTPYQKLEVVDTVSHGRLLLLDGCVMLTERDEFVYHEMISHLALCTLPAPRQVLVVGGGDGGTVREVLKHVDVERVVLAEIDLAVVRASQHFFPTLASAISDPRCEVYIGDGVTFLAQTAACFDLIIVDSTDPVGAAAGLFQPVFYQLAESHLTSTGMLSAQMESPFWHEDFIRTTTGHLRQVFPIVELATGFVPTYPGGFWCWALASKRYSPRGDFLAARAQRIEGSCRYYSAEHHLGSLMLPRMVRTLLEP
jgi:spermidine synthase